MVSTSSAAEIRILLEQLVEKAKTLDDSVTGLERGLREAIIDAVHGVFRAIKPLLRYVDRLIPGTAERGIWLVSWQTQATGTGEIPVYVDRDGGFFVLMPTVSRRMTFGEIATLLSRLLGLEPETVALAILEGLLRAFQDAVDKAEERERVLRQRLASIRNVVETLKVPPATS